MARLLPFVTVLLVCSGGTWGDGETLHPMLQWAQIAGNVALTINMGSLKAAGGLRDEKVRLLPNGTLDISFEAMPRGSTEFQKYAAHLALFGEVNTSISWWHVDARQFAFDIVKKGSSSWPRLLRSPARNPFVRVDWEKFDVDPHAHMEDAEDMKHVRDGLKHKLDLAQKRGDNHMVMHTMGEIETLAKETEDPELVRLAAETKNFRKAMKGISKMSDDVSGLMDGMADKFEEDQEIGDEEHHHDPWGYNVSGMDKHAQNHDAGDDGKRLRDLYHTEGDHHVVRLTNYTFKEVVFDKRFNVLVQFYDSKVQECKEFAQKYRDVASHFRYDDDVKIAAFNMHASFGNFRLAGRLHATGYVPPVIFFSNKSATKDAHLEGYDQDLEVDDIVSFVKSGGFGETAHFPLGHESMEHDHLHGTFNPDTHEGPADLPHHYDEI